MSAIIEPQSATWWVSDRWAYRSALTCMIRGLTEAVREVLK